MAESAGVDRRTLIKGAAVAGAAAWTAPMIVDSLASPAAAASATCGPGTPNLSYGIIVYRIGSTYYTVKVAGNSCTATNSTSGDVSGCLNYTCGSETWTNPGGTVTRNGVATSVGNCSNITIHNSSGWVSANNGVTIVFVFAHDGSFGSDCNKISCFACLDQDCATVC
jgi:hypothetical protein